MGKNINKPLGVIILSILLACLFCLPAVAGENENQTSVYGNAADIILVDFDQINQTDYSITQGASLPQFPSSLTGYDANYTAYALDVTWSSGAYNGLSGTYVFEAVLPDGYAFASGINTPQIVLVVSGPERGSHLSSLNSAVDTSLLPLSAGTVDTTVSDAAIVAALVGSGVTPFNINVTGDPLQRGLYSGAGAILEIDSGIVMSTGDANDSFSAFYASTAFRNPGDADLDLAAGTITQDAIAIEFDFIPQTSTISFQFIFASNEWDQVHFDDVFALFVNGNNRALMPSGSPVSIGSVLSESGIPWTSTTPASQGYFVNTEGTGIFGFTGKTVVLTCSANVTPGEVTRIKLVIADVGDYIVDSALFIQAGSIGALPELPVAGDTTLPWIWMATGLGVLAVVALGYRLVLKRAPRRN